MKKICSILAIIGTAIINSACMGPPNVPPIQEIKPNETAFVIPLEGDGTAQAQVQSVEYLKKKMVQAKRITIPIRQRDTGRFPGDFEWIPTVRVITVDRSLVTRQWSGMPVAGNAHPGIHVESKESINFRVGFNVTALVQEEDAATYLYWHAGKQLSEAPVRDFMTPDPVVLRHDDPIAVAIHKMAVGGFRHIPDTDFHLIQRRPRDGRRHLPRCHL